MLNPYDLSPDSFSAIEAELLNHPDVPQDSLGAIFVPTLSEDGHFGAIGRTLEVTCGFREVINDMAGVEQVSQFVYIFDRDTQPDPRITHATRLFQAHSPEESALLGKNILYDLADQVELEEAAEYHGIEDLTDCLFVATDMAVPENTPTRHKPYGLIAYKVILEYAMQEGLTHMFAYMNAKTIRNFGRLDIKPEPLCGRTDYVITPCGDIKFEKYQPYVVDMRSPYEKYYANPVDRESVSRWATVLLNSSIPSAHIADHSA